MEVIDIVLVMLAIVIFVLVHFVLFPYVKKVYFKEPVLEIGLVLDSGASINKGLSLKNKTTADGVRSSRPLYVFEVTWNFKIKITNLSGVTAYGPQLHFLNHQVGFTQLETLDPDTTLQGNEYILLSGAYVTTEEVTADKRTKTYDLPESFDDLRMWIAYKNARDKEFFTVFSNSNDGNKNTCILKKPKGFNQGLNLESTECVHSWFNRLMDLFSFSVLSKKTI